MTPQQRKAIQRQVQLSLRKQAVQSVDGALADERLLREIAGQFGVADSPELRHLIQSAGLPVRTELHDAARRQSLHNLWSRHAHGKPVIITLLVLLMAVGAALRFNGIAGQSQWLDEYWAVYLATGRGQQIFELPFGKILSSPPPCKFNGAPAAWHIWSGIASVIHPPAYYLLLRAWIDLFGESDFATRSMSAVFSLAAALLLFDVVRRGTGSRWQGLAAAAFICLCPVQIDFSQQTRPYTLLVFLGLVVCDLLMLVESRGPSRGRIVALTAASIVLALTHYFAAGAFVAIGLYSLIRLRGATRAAVIGALLIAFCFVAATWGPMLWKARALIAEEGYVKGTQGVSFFQSVIDLPQRLLFEPRAASGYWVMLGAAVAVYLLPVFRLRRNPQLPLWWLWVVCIGGFLLLLDLQRQTHLIAVTRFLLLASPGVYAILATPFPTRIGQLVPPVFLFAAAAAAFAHWQAGPEPRPDIRSAAHWIQADTGPGDLVVIAAGTLKPDPSFDYFAIAHYIGDWRQPVVLLGRPAGPQLLAALEKCPRVWIWGPDVSDFLPGWHLSQVRQNGVFSLCSAVPPSRLKSNDPSIH